jgi:arylformamidase
MKMAINKKSASEWIDISYPLGPDMLHVPIDPIPPHLDWVSHPSKGSDVAMFQLYINPHHGTHVDAPRHFFQDKPSIDEIPVDALMGKVRVIEIHDKESIKSQELVKHDIREGERILFKTRNSALYKSDKFIYDFVGVSIEAARYLAEKKISVVGLDYFAIASITSRDMLIEVHQIFLGRGILILETIDLSGVAPGLYELRCLPIAIVGGDAAPARALLRPWKSDK